MRAGTMERLVLSIFGLLLIADCNGSSPLAAQTSTVVPMNVRAKKLTKSCESSGGCVTRLEWGVELRDGAGCAARDACPVFGNTAFRSVMERQALPLDDARQRVSCAPLRLSPSVAFEEELESVVEYFDQMDIWPWHFLRRTSHTRAWRSRPAQSHYTAGGSRPCA